MKFFAILWILNHPGLEPLRGRRGSQSLLSCKLSFFAILLCPVLSYSLSCGEILREEFQAPSLLPGFEDWTEIVDRTTKFVSQSGRRATLAPMPEFRKVSEHLVGTLVRTRGHFHNSKQEQFADEIVRTLKELEAADFPYEEMIFCVHHFNRLMDMYFNEGRGDPQIIQWELNNWYSPDILAPGEAQLLSQFPNIVLFPTPEYISRKRFIEFEEAPVLPIGIIAAPRDGYSIKGYAFHDLAHARTYMVRWKKFALREDWRGYFQANRRNARLVLERIDQITDFDLQAAVVFSFYYFLHETESFDFNRIGSELQKKGKAAVLGELHLSYKQESPSFPPVFDKALDWIQTLYREIPELEKLLTAKSSNL